MTTRHFFSQLPDSYAQLVLDIEAKRLRVKAERAAREEKSGGSAETDPNTRAAMPDAKDDRH